MKKLLLLVFLMMAICACSTADDVNSDLEQQAATASTQIPETAGLSATSDVSCLNSLNGKVYVDVSNGFNNPIVVFLPLPSGDISEVAKFNLRVEIQPLADCDDLNSSAGPVAVFAHSTHAQTISSLLTGISILPSQLPACYKWRLVLEGVSGTQKHPVCTAASAWQEAPLF